MPDFRIRYQDVQEHGERIARAIDNLADAVRSTGIKPTGVRELELDRRVGAAVRYLAGHGANKFTIVGLRDAWDVLVISLGDDGTLNESIHIKRADLVHALEYAARNWPR